jgi:hypothetical protein
VVSFSRWAWRGLQVRFGAMILVNRHTNKVTRGVTDAMLRSYKTNYTSG